jgi:phospholipid/cholesterol/gamma-HCH transport system substrate-binding protein
LYDDLKTKITQLQRGLHSAADTTSSVGKALYTDEMYTKVSEPLRQLDESLSRLQSGQGSLGPLLQDPKQYQQAMTQAGNLRKSIADLHQGEWLQSDAAYKSWIAKLEGIEQKVAEFDASPAMATPAVYDNLTQLAKEMADTAREFRENPRKYLRLKVF